MKFYLLFTLFFIAVVQADYVLRSLPIFARHLVPRQSTCDAGQTLCSFGGCCPGNTTCAVINNTPGCCPAGQNCGQQQNSNLVCDSGSFLCSDDSVCCENGSTCVSNKGTTGCCPKGQKCAGTTLTANKNTPTPTPSATKPAPTTTSAAPQATTTSQSTGQQNGCQAGFLSCNDGTGGCCPSNSQCITDSSGVPGCSITCATTDTKCPGGGCCTGGLQCDLNKPGFCLPANSTSTDASVSPVATKSETSTVGRTKATASVIGGGNINFGPTISQSSLAQMGKSIPELSMLIPSLVMGFVIVGAFVAI